MTAIARRPPLVVGMMSAGPYARLALEALSRPPGEIFTTLIFEDLFVQPGVPRLERDLIGRDVVLCLVLGGRAGESDGARQVLPLRAGQVLDASTSSATGGLRLQPRLWQTFAPNSAEHLKRTAEYFGTLLRAGTRLPAEVESLQRRDPPLHEDHPYLVAQPSQAAWNVLGDELDSPWRTCFEIPSLESFPDYVYADADRWTVLLRQLLSTLRPLMVEHEKASEDPKRGALVIDRAAVEPCYVRVVGIEAYRDCRMYEYAVAPSSRDLRRWVVPAPNAPVLGVAQDPQLRSDLNGLVRRPLKRGSTYRVALRTRIAADEGSRFRVALRGGGSVATPDERTPRATGGTLDHTLELYVANRRARSNVSVHLEKAAHGREYETVSSIPIDIETRRPRPAAYAGWTFVVLGFLCGLLGTGLLSGFPAEGALVRSDPAITWRAFFAGGGLLLLAGGLLVLNVAYGSSGRPDL